MSILIKTYRTLQFLSIDVVLGGLLSGSMVTKILNVQMPWIWWLALPISIWVIYTADHLLDAYRLKNQAHTERHLFHHQYFKLIGSIWLLFFLSCISWIAYLVPQSMLFLGFFMGILVLIHLGLVKLIGDKISWLFHKELGVGGIYALGVWGGPAVMAWEGVQIPEISMFMQFFILALMNLFIFSMYEMDTDKQDGHTSFVLAIGKKHTKMLISFMGVMILALGAYVIQLHSSSLIYSVQGIYLCMVLIFLALTFFEERFKKQEWYRVLGDGVFLLPGFV